MSLSPFSPLKELGAGKDLGITPGYLKVAGPVIDRMRRVWSKCNDLALNIDTAPLPSRPALGLSGSRPWYRAEFSPSAKYDDGNGYASPDYSHIYRIARILKPAPQDVFYDLGSGKGRVLCVMARKRIKKCVGVELFEHLCERARLNADGLRGKRSTIEIICEDAAKVDLSDGTIYFMFNPFGAETMRDVLNNIEKSLWKNPRGIIIVYHNALLEALLEERSWLKKYQSFSTANGARVSFWKNRP